MKLVYPDHRDSLDREENLDHRDLREKRDCQEALAQLDLRDHLENLDLLVCKIHKMSFQSINCV